MSLLGRGPLYGKLAPQSNGLIHAGVSDDIQLSVGTSVSGDDRRVAFQITDRRANQQLRCVLEAPKVRSLIVALQDLVAEIEHRSLRLLEFDGVPDISVYALSGNPVVILAVSIDDQPILQWDASDFSEHRTWRTISRTDIEFLPALEGGEKVAVIFMDAE